MTNNPSKQVYIDDQKYDVVDIKNGGMGRVWLLQSRKNPSIDPIHKTRIAVKTFDFTPDHYAINQELNSWVALDHKNIVPLLKIGRLNYRIAAIMPWLSGTLADEMAKKTIFSEDESIAIAIQIVEALKYAYDNYGIVHLDLKPANVLVQYQNPLRIQISDWGISRIAANIIQANWSAVDNENQYTAFGAGTPLYMSPERFSSKWKISPKADMYSLGFIIIQLLTGVIPFRFNNQNPYHEIINGSYVDNAKGILNVKSRNLEKLIFDCISPNIDLRPGDYKKILLSLLNL